MLFVTSYIIVIFLSHQLAKYSGLSVPLSDVEPEYQRHRFKSLKCISENRTVIDFRYCRVKVTRNSSGFAINMTLHQKLQRPINMRLVIQYKYGLIYREVFKVNEFELCGVLKNFNLMPPFMKAVFDVFGDSMALLLKGCPYLIGEMNLLLVADVSKFPSIFPTGMYKTHVFVGSPTVKLLHFIVEIEMVSSIKTSF